MSRRLCCNLRKDKTVRVLVMSQKGEHYLQQIQQTAPRAAPPVQENAASAAELLGVGLKIDLILRYYLPTSQPQRGP